MTDKLCPGPVCGNGNTAGGFREAVCIHTTKVYDSCKSKECLRDIRVYLCRDSQQLLNSGGIASIKPRAAELLCVKIDVEHVQFNRGFYTVDIRFFYKIECEVSCSVGRPQIIVGLSVFDKRVILFGSEGGARIFSSRYVQNGCDVQLAERSNMPTAVVEVVDPILLDARAVSPATECNRCCCCLNELPGAISPHFHGDDLVLGCEGNQLFVTLGQFSIIRLERDIQLLIPAYDICMPRRDCSNTGQGEAQDPCSVFDNFEFPIDEFFPPKMDHPDIGYRGNLHNLCGCAGSNPTTASNTGCNNNTGCGNNNNCGCKTCN